MLDTGNVYSFAGHSEGTCERRFYPHTRVWEYKKEFHGVSEPGAPKAFFEYHVGIEKECRLPVSRYGICGGRSFVMDGERCSVVAVDGSDRESWTVEGAISMTICDGQFVRVCVDGFRLGIEGTESVTECDLGNTVKILEDPLNAKRFFCLSRKTKDLRVVTLVDGKLRSWILKSNVDDFDVSNEHILYVLDNTSYVFNREDTVISPILQKKIENSRAYVDDEYYYEFDESKFVLSVWTFKRQLVQKVNKVAFVYKCSDIVLQYRDGAIAGVRKKPVLYDISPLAVACDGKKMVSWFGMESDPAIETYAVESPSSGIDSTVELVFMKLIAAVNAQSAFAISSAEKLADHYEKALDAISSQVDTILGRVPGYTSQQCTAMRSERRFADSLRFVARRNVRVFANLCRDGTLSKAIATDQLISEEIIEILNPLFDLFKEDPETYAQPLLDSISALDLDDDDDTSLIQEISTTVSSMQVDGLSEKLREIVEACQSVNHIHV